MSHHDSLRPQAALPSVAPAAGAPPRGGRRHGQPGDTRGSPRLGHGRRAAQRAIAHSYVVRPADHVARPSHGAQCDRWHVGAGIRAEKPVGRLSQRVVRRRLRRGAAAAVRLRCAIFTTNSICRDRSCGPGRICGRGGSAGRRLATLRRPLGQERSRSTRWSFGALDRPRAAACALDGLGNARGRAPAHPHHGQPREARPAGRCVSMRTAEEGHFATHDGVSQFYRRWPASTVPPRGAILLFHRGHEHGARMAHLVEELDLPDFEFYAWDARGHGRSPGERGYSPSFASSVRDIQTFVDHIGKRHDVEPERMAVVAQSVGAVVASTWAHDYAPRIRAMVLASPAFHVKLYVPFARPGLALMQKWRGNFFVQSYVKAKLLTHDRERQASFTADPLITRAISVNILL